MPGVFDVTNFLAQTAVTHVVSTAITTGVNAILIPTQVLLAVGTAVATSAATFLIMTTAKLALSGAVYVGSQAVNGVTYFFYQQPPQKLAIKAKSDVDDWVLI